MYHSNDISKQSTMPATDEKKRKSANTIFIIAGAFVLFALIACVGYHIIDRRDNRDSPHQEQPTDEATGDNQVAPELLTYTNSKYPGFSFNYYDTWRLSEKYVYPGRQDPYLEVKLQKDNYTLSFAIKPYRAFECNYICYKDSEAELTHVYNHLARVHIQNGYSYDPATTIRGYFYQDGSDIDIILEHYLASDNFEEKANYIYCSDDCRGWVNNNCEEPSDCNHLARITAVLEFEGAEDNSVVTETDSIVLSILTSKD